MTLSSALFVHPHPDDESIACGGVIAAAVAAGRPVVVVTCTGGEAGDNQSGIDLGGRGMGEVRRAEMDDAIVELGSPEHHWLGYHDSGMAIDDHGRVVAPTERHADAFHDADLDQAAGRLAELIRRWRPGLVVSDDERGTYGHPDHIKAHQVTVRAVELAADPKWGQGPPWRVPRRAQHTLSRARMLEGHNRMLEMGVASPFGDEPLPEDADLPMGVPDEQVTTRVDIREHLATKRRAMAAHRSQIGPDSFFLNMPDDVAGDWFGTEEYVIVDGKRSIGDDVDLFAGLDRN